MVRCIKKKDLEIRTQSKGLTINGIPLVVSPLLIHLVNRERDREDGLILYEEWRKEATLFTDLHHKNPCYYCHPDMRDGLVSQVRRN